MRLKAKAISSLGLFRTRPQGDCSSSLQSARMIGHTLVIAFFIVHATASTCMRGKPDLYQPGCALESEGNVLSIWTIRSMCAILHI